MDNIQIPKTEKESLAVKIKLIADDEEGRLLLYKEMKCSIYSLTQDDLDKRFSV